MMKYLLVLLVVAVAVWMAVARVRASARRRGGGSPASTQPRAMARCAHCGVHLPAAEALIEGSSVYCCDEHRRLGAGAKPRQ